MPYPQRSGTAYRPVPPADAAAGEMASHRLPYFARRRRIIGRARNDGKRLSVHLLAHEVIVEVARAVGRVDASNVLADRRWFTLDEESWRAFEELLERPAEYKPRLAELLAADVVFVD